MHPRGLKEAGGWRREGIQGLSNARCRVGLGLDENMYAHTDADTDTIPPSWIPSTTHLWGFQP